MSKRKAYNPQKRFQRLANATMKHVGVLYVGGKDVKCQLIDMRTTRIFNPGLATAKTVSEGRFKWSIFCAIFCRDQDNKDYMKSLLVVVPRATRQQDIADQVNDIHRDMLKTCNRDHVLNLGWIACTDGRDLNENAAGKIFENADAWDYLAGWEAA